MRFFICLIGLVFFQDVSGQSIAELNAKIANLETKIVVLETKVSMLEENNKALNLRIDNILLNMKPGLTTSNPEIKSTQNSNIQQQNTVDAPSVSTPAKVNTSSGGQCSATTKKGSRCSRKASSNGYCWQHGGN
jgi:hypothetical protein